jgi:hypothetical protein
MLIRSDLLDLKEEIEDKRAKLSALQDEYNSLLRKCPHDIQPRSPGIAVCVVCQKHFGWWCPESPKHFCEYGEDPDSCIYCGQPEERK